ncbi:MAG: HAMP domain-containing histidine kinase, partial [Deltaproteobacteria bacterium]|nr:HAMP domain-containing histidine kinase [Deltaproteobacteria bacterium]
LNRLTSLSTNILATDAACIEEEKRLLKIFLTQMRSAEKYVLLRDKVFYSYFTQGNADFDRTIDKVSTLLETVEEEELVRQIKEAYARYLTALSTALSNKKLWNKEKTGASDEITEGINALIELREGTIAGKTAAGRDEAAAAARVMAWLTLGGISIAVLLAYFQARGVSQPLKTLTQELRYVGKGEFRRSVEVHAPREIGELARAFNWMAERLAELDEMKADFIAHVSHELRTPLAAIQEGTALLLEEIPGPVTAAQREVLEVVRNHSARLFQSISSVLDLSKMAAGMMEYVRVPADLGPLITRSVETVQLLAQKKHILLAVARAFSLPLLSVDEGRIQQVLDNLLGNAVKFTPVEGSITISATVTGEGNSQGEWVEVRVADSGIGIPEEDLEKIFERFYQSPSHNGEHARGTGLGLAIARHVVEAHGGKIWAENRSDKGAIVIFTLPIERNHQEEEKEEMPALGPPLGGSNVL